MKNTTTESPKGCAIVIALVALAVLLFVIRAFTVFPHKKLDQLKPGMTMQDVEGALGRPSSIHTYSNTVHWNYKRKYSFGYGGVTFDTNGVVLYPEYEEF